MSYKSILIQEYQANQNNEEFDAIKEFENRINNPATFKTAMYPLLTAKNGVQFDDRAIFFVETADIANKVNKIYRNSVKIDRLNIGLPDVARSSFINSLLTDEIKFTNEIEGIKTHKSEIGTIVGELKNNDFEKISSKRLASTIKMYNDILSQPVKKIKNYQDLREMYEKLTKGEIEEGKEPDGEFFRNDRVYIGESTRETHVPPITEKQIKPKISSLIEFMNDNSYPNIEKAIITHFMFENTHPFYDGNGRTGRYLLSQYIGEKVDRLTALSLSYILHENETKYYKMFKDAEQYENFAELTFFIDQFLTFILEAQMKVIVDLSELTEKLHKTRESFMQRLKEEMDVSDKEEAILFIFIQSKLFAIDKSLGIKDTELVNMLYKLNPKYNKKREARRIIDKFEKAGILNLIGERPKQHEIKIDL